MVHQIRYDKKDQTIIFHDEKGDEDDSDEESDLLIFEEIDEEEAEKERYDFVHSLRIFLDGIDVKLVDDAFDETIPIAAFYLEKSKGKVVIGALGYLYGSFSVSIAADYFNESNQSWEPVLRGFKLNNQQQFLDEILFKSKIKLSRGEEGGILNVRVDAENPISVVVSKASIEKIIELSEAWSEQSAKKVDKVSSDRKIIHSYYIRNETGRKLNFWLTGNNNVHLLEDHQEKQLYSDENHFLSEFKKMENQRKMQEKNTLNFQMENSSFPVKKLPINMIRSFALPLDNKTVIYEVNYKKGSKYCTIRSNILIQNLTNHNLHIQFSPSQLNKEQSNHFEAFSNNRTLDAFSTLSIPVQYSNSIIQFTTNPNLYKWSSNIDLTTLTKGDFYFFQSFSFF